MIDEAYLCGTCGDRHDGPAFSYGTDAPVYWRTEFAHDKSSVLEEELCVIKAEHYFVRARLVLPVADAEDDFEWGVWVSLSRENFRRTVDLWTTPGREAEPAYFGWLSTEIPAYAESTVNLKTHVHTGPVGTRPHVTLEPTDHPLAVEQRTGITVERVREIAEALRHG